MAQFFGIIIALQRDSTALQTALFFLLGGGVSFNNLFTITIFYQVQSFTKYIYTVFVYNCTKLDKYILTVFEALMCRKQIGIQKY